MAEGTVDITVEYRSATVQQDPGDVFSELTAEEQDSANADTVVTMLKGHKSKLRALREWELIDDDAFTIRVSVKGADGTVTNAEW